MLVKGKMQLSCSNIFWNWSSQEVKGHRSCRRKFTDKRKMASKQIPTKRLNSSLEVRFNCKVQCFLCSKSIKFYSKHPYSEVMTLQLRETLNNNLVAENPKYHTNRMAKFHLKDGADREEDSQKMYRWLRVLEGHVVVDSKLSILLQYIIRWCGPLQGISDWACRKYHDRTTGRPGICGLLIAWITTSSRQQAKELFMVWV